MTSRDPLNHDIASTAYARRRKELFELTKALRSTGADDFLGVPRIAVIGGQSAGKSSLVEAVTGINVPRDSGTCTRCPMECSVAASAEVWSCQISLRWKYDPRGRPRDVKTIPFGPRLTDKGEVEIQIRRAQAAILSPNVLSDNFLTKSYEDLRALADRSYEKDKEIVLDGSALLDFSKNEVVVEIEDPDGTDISFIDLPGLIQNADQEAIDLVRTLVTEYIEEPSTIILVTIPVSDDIENQQAVKLAKEADPEGARTIGVLTKPDTLTAGATNARKRWQDVIRGRVHPLALGYYCVRLPEDIERIEKVSRDEMERRGTAFFRSTAPWNELQATNKLGVRNLVSDLSKLLMRIIEASLPFLKDEVNKRLENCRAELSGLPPPSTGDPATEILNMVTSFCSDLREVVYGNSTDKKMVHQVRAAYSRFKVSINRTAPDFRPFEHFSQYRKPTPPAESEEEDDPNEAGSEEEDDPNEADSEDCSGSGMKPMGLYEVRQVIKESTGWELPRNVPYAAKMRLYRRFVDLWHAPARVCYNRVVAILNDMVEMNICSHFGRYKQLEGHIRPVILQEVCQVAETCSQAVAQVLQREERPYYTQNLHYLHSVYAKWLYHYRFARRNHAQWILTPDRSAYIRGYELGVEVGAVPDYLERAYSPADVSESAEMKALEALQKAGYAGLTGQDLVRLHPPDRFEDELVVMADVRAYFQVAYKRIIDNIPLTIEHSLNQAVVDHLQACLIDKLNLGAQGSSERLKALLADDPHMMARRELLQDTIQLLSNIYQQLMRF